MQNKSPIAGAIADNPIVNSMPENTEKYREFLKSGPTSSLTHHFRYCNCPFCDEQASMNLAQKFFKNGIGHYKETEKNIPEISCRNWKHIPKLSEADLIIKQSMESLLKYT